MTEQLAGMDATAQAELVRSGEASPAELAEAAIDRIESLNGELNAVIHPLFEKGLGAARGELPDGPFRGVPLLLKDLTAHSAGDPMHEGMKHLRDLGWSEDADTELVRRLRAAGFVILGRTNTPELGILPTCEPEAHGPTRNPWDAARSPGGSSGGSAAAVAAGMVAVAHAGDGGGSIRIPAAACGVVGLKPSRGRVSLAPEFGDVMTGLVAEHVVTRSVRDSAAVLDAIHGIAPGDPYCAPTPERPYREEVGADPGPLRIGLMTTAPAGQFEVHPDCIAAAKGTAGVLESLGHSTEASHPDAFDDPTYTERFIQRWTAGIAWNLDYWSRRTGQKVRPEGVEESTWALAELGRNFSGPEYLAALEYQQRAARDAAAWWEGGFDLLLTPTMGEPPTPLGAFEPEPDNPASALIRAIPTAGFTAFWNSTGQPGISLPLHWSEDGLPIGVQLVAPFGREDLLIRVAAQLEEARPWADRLPARLASGAEVRAAD
jgi:amidase